MLCELCVMFVIDIMTQLIHVGLYCFPLLITWKHAHLKSYTNVLMIILIINVVYALNQKFSEEGVGLCEEMGFQPISVFTTDVG